MKSLKKINADILKITMEIQNSYPEIAKYLNEMPVTLPDLKDPLINRKAMQDYYDSLCVLLKKYSTNHNKEK